MAREIRREVTDWDCPVCRGGAKVEQVTSVVDSDQMVAVREIQAYSCRATGREHLPHQWEPPMK